MTPVTAARTGVDALVGNIHPSKRQATTVVVAPRVQKNQTLFIGTPEAESGGGLPTATSAAAAIAIACARGVGGRLGTPLGSAFPAPGSKDWATGRSVAGAASMASARVKKLSNGGNMCGSSLTPGSRIFPPFGLPTGGGGSSESSSPVVLEMVKDAADDEKDTLDGLDRSDGDEGLRSSAEECGKGERGWHGLTLYRFVDIGPLKFMVVALGVEGRSSIARRDVLLRRQHWWSHMGIYQFAVYILVRATTRNTLRYRAYPVDPPRQCRPRARYINHYRGHLRTQASALHLLPHRFIGVTAYDVWHALLLTPLYLSNLLPAGPLHVSGLRECPPGR